LKIPIREGRQEVVLDRPNREKKIIGITVSVLRDISGSETGYIGIFRI